MKKLLPVLMLLSGCFEDGERLDADAIAALFNTEKTVSFESFRFTGTATLKADKTADLSIPALGQDTGVWWLDRDRICSKWEEASDGETACALIERFADGTYAGVHPETGLRIGTFSLASP